ncbi:MAG: IS110 family transposase [Chloroflexi bacterium]|nr:IS110 family transposase [Chloroflexota bacterium]
MRVLYERCCGLDVHKKSVTACVLTPEGRETRTFGTMTADLLELADWLLGKAVTHVAMESTGVFWKPPYNLLEGTGLELLVVNAAHIKAVPGRKTDVRDAEWIAELLQHGLLRGSFIPERPQRELRELVRYRTQIIRERVRAVQRIQKLLEGANIKLSSVATDILGVSGRAMLSALAAGETDPAALAAMARGRLKSKRPELEAALRGLVGEHQRLLLQSGLRHLDFLEEEIARLDEEVKGRMVPFQKELEALDAIPGCAQRSAESFLAEVGSDVSRFPTHRPPASWARICPGTNESAGKRRSGATGHGNQWLRGTLVEMAHGAARSRGYLGAQYHRIAARRGKKRAAVAVGHSILVMAYHVLRDDTPYRELGRNYFDERDRKAVTKNAVKRLERLGFKVTLEEATKVA